MKKNNLTVVYDAEADVLSLETSGNTIIDYAKETGNLVVHFNKKEEPVLVEVLNASHLFKKQGKSVKQNRELVLA